MATARRLKESGDIAMEFLWEGAFHFHRSSTNAAEGWD